MLKTQWREPRFLLRAIIGVLLAANVAAAIIAFKPFGGGAEDLARQENALQQQLATMNRRIQAGKMLVDKMQNARKGKDQFLAKYIADEGVFASTLSAELERIATTSGVKPLPTTVTETAIEGSDSLLKVSVNYGCEGNYVSLAKFINLVDKSPNFLIIESLQTSAPHQAGAALSLTLKIDTFVNGSESVR